MECSCSELADAWDFRIFVDVPFEEALRRACLRDAAQFSSVTAVRERYDGRYFPAQRRYLDTVCPREHADAVLVNTDPEHLTLRLKAVVSGVPSWRPLGPQALKVLVAGRYRPFDIACV
jgi:uridine kinase